MRAHHDDDLYIRPLSRPSSSPAAILNTLSGECLGHRHSGGGKKQQRRRTFHLSITSYFALTDHSGPDAVPSLTRNQAYNQCSSLVYGHTAISREYRWTTSTNTHLFNASQHPSYNVLRWVPSSF